jgi:hypothetical protein
VFISPSWPPYSLLELVGADLIDGLLAAGHEVIVRPHRDAERLAGESLGELRDRFQGRPNFTLATGRPEGDEFFNADVLIASLHDRREEIALSIRTERERWVFNIGRSA